MVVMMVMMMIWCDDDDVGDNNDGGDGGNDSNGGNGIKFHVITSVQLAVHIMILSVFYHGAFISRKVLAYESSSI